MKSENQSEEHPYQQLVFCRDTGAFNLIKIGKQNDRQISTSVKVQRDGSQPRI